MENVADNPLEEKNESLTVYEQEVSIQYAGPVPHPLIFEGLKKVDPSFSERVMKMAEANNDAEIRIKEQKSKRKQQKIGLEARGQLFIFILALILIGVSVFLVLKGYGLIAIVPFLGGISPIITTVINNLMKK
jgi:uncharacterized membrane protein